nr:hypothetical protein [Priestia flexa]WEZ10411.1 hypothetical protein P5663_21010 [Priestia flexa]
MLWVFTQNKQSLVNVKEITVKGKNVEGVIGSSNLDQWSMVLGKYDSNNRALQIVEHIFLEIEESSNQYITFSMPKK